MSRARREFGEVPEVAQLRSEAEAALQFAVLGDLELLAVGKFNNIA